LVVRPRPCVLEKNMIPSSFDHEAVWALLAGVAFAVLMGGFGGGLLVWAAWKWSLKRIRTLRTSVRSMMTEPVGVGQATEPTVQLEPADR
jgi:hypothetical protein